MEEKFKIVHNKDDSWQVLLDDGEDQLWEMQVLHQGSLADCEAFIRLRKDGYL